MAARLSPLVILGRGVRSEIELKGKKGLHETLRMRRQNSGQWGRERCVLSGQSQAPLFMNRRKAGNRHRQAAAQDVS